VRAQIETIPGVVATTRHYSLPGSLAFDKEKNGKYKTVSGVITGIDPDNEGRVLDITTKLLLAGKRLENDDTDQVLIGTAMAGGLWR